MKRRALVIGVSLSGLPCFATAQPAQPAGCYDVRIGAWTPSLSAAEDTSWVTLPARIELDTARAEDGGFVMRPGPYARGGWRMSGSWMPQGSDSISMVWPRPESTGRPRGRLDLRLARRADGLDGIAIRYRRFDTEPQRAPVTAERTDCLAPAPPNVARYIRIPTAIHFSGGDTLRLGERLPGTIPGAQDSVRIAGPTTDAMPGADFFGGFPDAEFSDVFLGPAGTIERIRLTFALATDAGAIRSALESQLGDPASWLRAQLHLRGTLWQYRWTDQVTRVWLSYTTGAARPRPATLTLELLRTDGA